MFCLFVRNLNNKQYLLKIYDSNFLIPFVSFFKDFFQFCRAIALTTVSCLKLFSIGFFFSYLVYVFDNCINLKIVNFQKIKQLGVVFYTCSFYLFIYFFNFLIFKIFFSTLLTTIFNRIFYFRKQLF